LDRLLPVYLLSAVITYAILVIRSSYRSIFYLFIYLKATIEGPDTVEGTQKYTNIRDTETYKKKTTNKNGIKH